ncbi:hypothetical protein VFPBJ_09689 [Purpureocillium lilacinum]|uniref:Uncharacterized protein n=1 Tax=Purpureocillium lilacinum TaxID=33203 RepID=A0A179GD22_PURLI|nr:hypothetical protein VFPBJ_09689 [Purpureocillium lilacinum]
MLPAHVQLVGTLEGICPCGDYIALDSLLFPDHGSMYFVRARSARVLPGEQSPAAGMCMCPPSAMLVASSPMAPRRSPASSMAPFNCPLTSLSVTIMPSLDWSLTTLISINDPFPPGSFSRCVRLRQTIVAASRVRFFLYPATHRRAGLITSTLGLVTAIHPAPVVHGPSQDKADYDSVVAP